MGLLLGMCGSAFGATAGEPSVVFSGLPHDAFFSVSFEGREGIAVGDFGLVVETRDGGRTWVRQARPPTDRALLAVARKAGRCLAGGQDGLIFAAEDCRHWRQVPRVTGGRILGIDVNADGMAYAVGGFGTLLKSTDWGTSWQVLKPDWRALAPDGVEPHLYDVHVADDGEVTIVGEFEMVMHSHDAGAHWNLLRKGRRSLFGLQVLEDGDIYAVGQEGLILRSTEDGHSWTELESGTTSILTGIWASPDGRIVASGMYTILHSSDGGASWHVDRSARALTGWHQAIGGIEQGDGRLQVVLVGFGGSILAVQR